MSAEAVPEAETEVEPADEPAEVAAEEVTTDDRVCECTRDNGVSVRDDGTFCRRCGLRK